MSKINKNALRLKIGLELLGWSELNPDNSTTFFNLCNKSILDGYVAISRYDQDRYYYIYDYTKNNNPVSTTIKSSSLKDIMNHTP